MNSNSLEFDYAYNCRYKDKPKFWDAVLVNDDLERAYAELKSLLQPKEESRATTAAASAAAAG